uniref:Uncharacterized protein n=1 Tax=viral metagenome TaxID=1070528 RepID=A0A6C0JW84_9ZZZZ
MDKQVIIYREDSKSSIGSKRVPKWNHSDIYPLMDRWMTRETSHPDLYIHVPRNTGKTFIATDLMFKQSKIYPVTTSFTNE